ncbi:hypothetical protein Pfo_016176 [Paulownia fortunei]|nr:hypothetical protein Pfo_016176 [Paulownia fortunei]
MTWSNPRQLESKDSAVQREFSSFLKTTTYLEDKNSGKQEPQEGHFWQYLTGFDEDFLAGSFNIDTELATTLKGESDHTGRIILARGLRLQPHGQKKKTSSLREENGDQMAWQKLYVFSPRSGWITTLNSQKLPNLNRLGLSAEKGVLYEKAIMAPHWSLEAHSMIHITSGISRIQVIRNKWIPVFKSSATNGYGKAGEQGCEWIAFKTSGNAEVLMNSYGISREDARKLKYNRKESTLFSTSTMYWN